MAPPIDYRNGPLLEYLYPQYLDYYPALYAIASGPVVSVSLVKLTAKSFTIISTEYSRSTLHG
jgi:hypothetical protein